MSVNNEQGSNIYPDYYAPHPAQETIPPSFSPQLYLIPSKDPATRLQPLGNKIVQIRDLLSSIIQDFDKAEQPHKDSLAKGFRKYYVIAAILWVAEAILAIKAYPYVASLGAWVAHQFATGSAAVGPMIGFSPIIIGLLIVICVEIVMGTLSPILCKNDEKSGHESAIRGLEYGKKYYTDLLETFNYLDKTINFIDSKVSEMHRTKYYTAVQSLYNALYNTPNNEVGLHYHCFQIFQQKALAPRDSEALDQLITQLQQFKVPQY